jgi:hypothetical protein
MSADRPVVYSSLSDSSGHVARFGFTDLGKNNRMVIYTTEVVHLTQTASGDENNETLFTNHPFYGITAISGEADEVTLDLVGRLANYARQSFENYVGIRISASDNMDYVSKIVFYMKGPAELDGIFKEIADALYPHVNAIVSRYVDYEMPSEAERRDLNSYNLLDW